MEHTKSTGISRRRLLAVAGVSAGAALLAQPPLFADPGANSPAVNATVRTRNTSFSSLKQIDAGLLNVGYAEAGPSNGRAVILLHGWPYDIYSFVDVTPLLAAAGYRVIVPHLRGFGTTRFLSSDTFRNGQQSVVALDIIALMDALKIEKAILAGFDWGARTADIMAALWPERCKALVSVSGYLIGSQAAGRARCRQRLSCNGGTSFILPPIAAGKDTRNTGTILRSSFGNWPRRSGTSMMPRSIALQRRSTTLIMLRS
jgi:pimeloyl-ACP methyl ester carboxylesterase